MEFIKLYRDNQKAVKKALKAMWCSDPHSDTQKQYAEQISTLIDTELFTSENYVPLVQCMDRYETIPHSDRDNANALVGGLWNKTFDPYKHQEKSWKELSQGNSIVVTTGTGSGKTECFMLPLVNDLNTQPAERKIKAIFLYPLNALMEDQKERLQELLKNTNLHFAVYNGNLPVDDGLSATTRELRDQLRRQVEEERKKYPNIVPTRNELWRNPPEIILTNPTMLEYMLIRNKDQHLFTPGSLRWIVIDEAHTFTGAGAAELAMLLRRVLDAFSIKSPDEIRFATSSATIGNAKTFDQKNKSIVKFIQDITGSTKVKAIDGRRVYKDLETDSEELRRCRGLLNVRDYVRLDDLFPSTGETIEEKLDRLDSLCTLDNPLKAKVHFFYRVPTNGLRVRLTEIIGHSLKVHSFAPTDATGAPYLELMRCGHCGEYFALGESVKGKPNKYKATSSTGNDLFDFDSSGNSGTKLIFSYTDRPIIAKDSDGNITVEIEDDSYKIDSANSPTGWRIVQNVQKCCPCCGERVLGVPERDDEDGDETLRNVQSFRVSGGFVSRILAPSILPNLMQSEDTSSPHHGEQYISFVDSRQSAAKATMQQNLEEERLWIYSRIYHALIQIKEQEGQQEVSDTLEYREFLKAKGKSQTEIDRMAPLIEAKSYMDWNDIFNLLNSKEDSDSERLAYQFANKREFSEEYDSNEQSVKAKYKSRYIYSVMIEQLGKRPKKAAAPETLGLFVSYYPKLEKINRLPDEVVRFNERFSTEIELNDWKSLLKMYLDSYVRSNESLYLMNGDGGDGFDIKNCCTRFGTTKPPRRPVHKPQIGKDKQGRYLSSIVLLATLIDPESDNINDTIYDNRDELNEVLDAFWNDLTNTTSLIQPSEYFNDTIDDWQEDKDRDANGGKQYRLNVADIAFKLYDRVWLCDSRMSKEKHPVPRPVDTLFKGYSPYIIGNKARKAISGPEDWTPYPFVKGHDGTRAVSEDEVLEWAEKNRKLLCDAGIWGRSGSYSERLEEIHLYPEIFIQAEHTAQVDKLIAKQSQELFKERQINILACSTTMEMGVDLGNLEMVVMTSVPPHPSNYKQRAGRSGRNDNPRSACITLCSSDSVGLRTILDPLENLINRPMQTPFVDLRSPQVIQRHANAYLFRLSGIFFNNNRGNANNLDQEIIEFFTPFSFGSDQYGGIRYDEIYDKITGQHKYPCDKLGDEHQTKYFEFKEFLNDCTINQRCHLEAILKDTIYDSCGTLVIQNCKDEIERCYSELFERADELAGAYEDAKNKAKPGKVSGDIVDTEYGRYLRHKYSALLSKNLIEFFATNRFSPNANMPVNVVEFDLSNGRVGKKDHCKTNNPSYPLQQAISQYSPGNTIVLENRTAVVRGLLYTGMFKSNVTFKKIYSDGTNTIIGEERKNMLQKLERWHVNGLEELTMIEPYAFIPDVNEEYSRVVEDAPYTQVSAQLIGAGDWADFSQSSSLISVRSNRECGDANILYYNEGIGFGYCFCSHCGKAVLESAPGRGLRNMPIEMNNQMRDAKGSPEYYHYMINRLGPRRGKKECYSRMDKIKRNVIIGGLIQTDYSEIRIRHEERAPWLSNREEESLLITLGIVFTQTFVESLGKNRQDVDFAITPNGHLCIFDTNPGGSGYSNQLVNLSIMQSVIDASEELLKRIKTKDELIDRYTKRYFEKIDITAALDWIKAEKDASGKLPAEVVTAYPTAKVAVFEDILNGFSVGVDSDSCLFVGTNWKEWLYQDNSVPPSLTWKARVNELRTRGSRKRLCIANAPLFIIRPIISILGQINDWADVVSSPIEMPNGLFPIAVVGGHFFFTNEEETTNLNADWCRGNVFCVEKSKMPTISFHPTSLEQLPTTQKFILGNSDPLKIKSSELATLVTGRMSNLLNEFLDFCSSHPEPLEITSQDEHLKSPISIVTTLQFFEWFLKKIRKPFSVEFLVEEYVDKFSYDIAKNIGDYTKRNDFLDEVTGGWLSDIDDAFGLKGTKKIRCYRKGTLPHWREIKFKCGNKELVLYPNGGLINEWYYDKFKDTVGITMDTISSEDEIPLYRHNSIMYDIEIRG